MQKLVFVNGAGETIDLTSGDFGITKWEGFSGADLNIQSQQVPFQDGAVFLDALIEQRELSVTVAMDAKGDLDKRYRLRRQMISILNPKLGEGLLIYTDNHLSKQIHVIPQIPLFETNNSNDAGTPKVSCSFTACNPYWEDLEETSVSISGLNTVVNNGDVPAQVEIIIPAGSINPSIANRRNQKQIKLQGTYDDSIEINTKVGNKSILENKTGFKWVAGGDFNDVTYGMGLYVYIGTQIVTENKLTGEYKTPAIVNSYELNSVCFGNNEFVAVGKHGTVITSSDGETFNITHSVIINNRNLTNIIYENNLYILLAEDGSIFTAGADHNFTFRNSGVELKLNRAIYGNNLFVVVGANGTILTSPDGINWTPRTSGVNYDLNSITYANGLFVAVGKNATILTSPDGINWTPRTSGLQASNLSGITYGKELFVVVSSSGNYMIYSPDGLNWTVINVSERAKNIIYSNNIFTKVGSSGLIANSNNGISWNVKNKNFSNSITNIVHINNLYFAFTEDSSSILYKSSDGINFSRSRSTTLNNKMNDITFGDGYYVLVCNEGIIIRIADFAGADTTQISGNYNLYSVTYGNGLFVAVGMWGRIYTSPDGLNWTLREGATKDLYNVIYENDRFIAVGLKTIITSDDGINWVDKSPDSTTTFRKVTYGKGIFVAVGNKIYASSDGDAWREGTYFITGDNYYSSVAYGNNIFIATYTDVYNNFRFSENGIDWSFLSVDNIPLLMNCIVFGDDKFVAGGESGFVANTYLSAIINIISDLSLDSDMTFNLEIGDNDILYFNDNGNEATLKYRQRYIGV